jgi:hypothetical protein
MSWVIRAMDIAEKLEFLKRSTLMHVKDVVCQFYFNKVKKILILILE